jgi:hypothetical protein
MPAVLSAASVTELGRALLAPPGDGDPHALDRSLPRDRRRAQGAFFTPQPLVDFVVAATLAPLLARDRGWRADGSPELVVLDPAAGDGRFLAAAAAWRADRAAARGADRAAALRAIVRRCLVGIERDAAFAAAARARLGAGAVVHCAEALVVPPRLPAADAVVGNPPYVRSIRLERSDPSLWAALRGRYAATSHGEWDLYAAFLEQSLAWLAPAGHAGLVVPSRWLTAAFAARLRGALATTAALRGVVDFGAWQLFDGATTYASVAFLSRAPVSRVFVARWRGPGWEVGELAARSLDARPWRLSVGRRRGELDRIARTGPALGAVARIAKGCGTNADPVYLLERARVRRRLVTGWSRALGADVEIEAAAVLPCVRGRDVAGYGAVDGSVICLVPYAPDGALLSPAALRAAWPRAWRYLEACRDPLVARERGRFADDRFYRFGRPQNLVFLRDRAAKVVVPDVARAGRALLDATGAFVLDSAYAIRPLAGPVEVASPALLLAVLNSPIVAWWLQETGVPLRGGYVRMKTAYLTSLPLPPASPHTRDAERLVERWLAAPEPAERGARDEISEAVRRAYRVPRARWAAIERRTTDRAAGPA